MVLRRITFKEYRNFEYYQCHVDPYEKLRIKVNELKEKKEISSLTAESLAIDFPGEL